MPLPALAQEPPAAEGEAPAPATPPEEALSPEEQAEIEAALGADEQAKAEGEPQDAAPAASSSIGPSQISFHGLDLSLVLDAAAAAFSSDEPLQTGGHDPTERGFNLQQLELSIGSEVDPYFRFDSNIVFSQFGVEVEEAYATTLALPANLQVRAGQFLTRFGRLNASHPHAWDFVDQPFALGRIFGGENNRGLGVEGSWLSPLPWYLELVGSVTDASGEGTARSFLGGEGGGVQSPLDFQFTGVLKQFFPFGDDLSLLWGLSAASGPNATGHRNRTDVYGTDVYLRYRPTAAGSQSILTWQTELFYRRRQVPDSVLTDLSGYSQLAWRFTKRWGVAARYELGTAAEDSDGHREDPLDPEWTEARQRVSANLTFWPSEFSRLRLQGARDHAGWRDAADYSAFLSLEVVVGAHGAHRF
ncbi:MAG TPA: zinc-regulated TonB-dependent outer membrane receptor [Aggregicoccus sp.]|nr:zinc-regulated TonB-dependent outer membrane receptor [Aggregicoccus sp.]